MTTLREAAQQALEALESLFNWQVDHERGQRCGDAVVALKDALAEPDRAQKMRDAGYTRRPTLREMAEPQEPVAWMVYTLDGKSVCVTDNPADFKDEHKALPLYTAPPQRKPLSEEEIEKCFRDAGITIKGHRWTNAVRNVEAAHGIK